MVQLQKPKYVWFGGGITVWEEARFHVSSEAVVRGLNVFEGLRGYWQPDGSFGFLALPRHWARLKRSAKFLHIPFDMTCQEWIDANHSLVQTMYEPGRSMWTRATLYVEEGHWGEGTKSNLVLTAFHVMNMPTSITTGVSTWQRGADNALPARIKTSSNYQVTRLAKVEGRSRGYPEMILLNQHGRVAESIGSCILVVRDGKVITPPWWEGALESITVDIIEELCKTMGIPFERRPIERTELVFADEMAFVGTLNEITLISECDGDKLREPRVLKSISQRYLNAVHSLEPHPAVDLQCRPYDPRQPGLLSAAE
ncbi:aminotransferase class IV [Bradyrhizobium sp. LHD-71]|uniref:aminotransferase class IV n=1 Tax=Bradyrhizobium sp. LHD-71 TaxID=3072141 RepID=UPI00280E14E2|nr:aminotransferase class IV [Bradyrhizobium sp. LHD-71]MDQ8730536.1 aminotransferase class IV [Bradyrhizobium sp. LHD-71]